ncbi:hypothetical protein ACOSQ4_028768 [Xanthoceras sorbifolium]
MDVVDIKNSESFVNWECSRIRSVRVRSAGVTSLGAIVRDSSCQVLIAKACNALPFLDVAFALWFGLILAKEAGLWPLQVESDCQSVVNNILAKCIPHLEIGLVFEDNLALLDDCRVESLSYVPRSANKGAHSLV